MAQCKSHPDREAVAVCSVCGEPICGECIAPGEGEPICFDCSISRAGEEVRERAPAGETLRAAPPGPPHSALSPGIKVVLAIGLVVILAELAIILFMGAPQPAPTAAPAALGPEKTATLGAVAETIVVSQSLESYKKAHGRYPDELSEIAGSLPGALRDRINDPSTGYWVDEQGGYHLELRAGAHSPIVVGPDLGAPVLKETEAQGVEP